MKKLFLSAMVLGVSALAVAAPVDQKTAAQVARNFMSANAGAKVSEHLVYTEWNHPMIHLFVGQGGGFVMVAADDVALPVLGYSDVAPFDAERIPIQLDSRLSFYENAIRRAASMGMPTDPRWQQYIDGIFPKDDPTTVEPLLQTRWDQDEPYNLYTPEFEANYWGYSYSGHAPTGCAATSQAQFMKYWNFPAFGSCSHSYDFNPNSEMPAMYGPIDFGTLTADFAHTLYGWDLMQNSYNSYGGSTNTPATDAVARLMSHVGIGLHMMYGQQASGAYCFTPDTLPVDDPFYASQNHSLRDFFFYSPDMQYLYKDSSFSDSAWTELIIADLNLGHPILYAGGNETEGGHSFVCDGYDARHYLHFNWGWSGSGDGYYPVSALKPNMGGGWGTGGGSYNFTENQEAILGCVPVYACRFSDAVISLGNGAADTSVLYMTDPTINTIATVECDAQWLVMDEAEIGVSGRKGFHVEANTTGAARTAIVTLRQGGDQAVTLRVIQSENPDAFVGIDDEAATTPILVWPNPVRDELNISAEGVLGATLYSMDGRKVATGTTTFSLGNMPKGVYMLRIETAEGITLRRVVKK